MDPLNKFEVPSASCLGALSGVCGPEISLMLPGHQEIPRQYPAPQGLAALHRWQNGPSRGRRKVEEEDGQTDDEGNDEGQERCREEGGRKTERMGRIAIEVDEKKGGESEIAGDDDDDDDGEGDDGDGDGDEDDGDGEVGGDDDDGDDDDGSGGDGDDVAFGQPTNNRSRLKGIQRRTVWWYSKATRDTHSSGRLTTQLWEFTSTTRHDTCGGFGVVFWLPAVFYNLCTELAPLTGLFRPRHATLQSGFVRPTLEPSQAELGKAGG
eukprot:1512669-Rhodomonas_salina.1